jgi:hypothetical protein
MPRDIRTVQNGNAGLPGTMKCTGFDVEGVYLMISIAAQVTLTRGVTLLQRAYNFYCERRARDTPAVSSE